MSKMILRVDERLLHGQVLVGWIMPLEIKRVIIIDKTIANDQIARNSYYLALPKGIELEILDEDNLPLRLTNDKNTIILLSSLKTALKVIKLYKEISLVNLGGSYSKPDRKKFTPFLHLSDDEIAILKEIESLGVKITIKELPNTEEYPLTKIFF